MSDTPPPADGWRQGPDGKWYGPDQQVPPVPSPPSPPSKEPDGGWSTAVGQGAPPKRNDGSGNRGCVWVILIVIVLAAIGAAVGDDDDGGGASASGTEAGGDEPDQEELEFGAFDVCTKFVKDRLKAPSTASFRNFFEDDGEVVVSGSGNGPYTVISSVDAENGFGANIRTNFVCEVRHTGGGNWRLVNLVLDE
jgi:hypothetical protein